MIGIEYIPIIIIGILIFCLVMIEIKFRKKISSLVSATKGTGIIIAKCQHTIVEGALSTSFSGFFKIDKKKYTLCNEDSYERIKDALKTRGIKVKECKILKCIFLKKQNGKWNRYKTVSEVYN